MDLVNKLAVVTGSQGNLAPIWARTLREAGSNVFGAGLPTYDITDKRDVEIIVDRCKAVYGKIPDIIVNNAGIDNPPGSDASFFGNCERILAVNLQGAVNICEAFIPKMVENKGGVVINIGSIMGNTGADWRNYPENFEKPIGYNLSKAGYIQLARSICTQYGRYNIRCVTISFGPYDNGQLTDDFKGKFLKNVPLGRTISLKSLETTLLYACTCPELIFISP
ncbi:MAG: SDR family NAD(P)-dependent oxidoreductase [Spirochaetota bacterium]|nr:SDR family NAD(P)-dependent oxidoreductase [Spirochaetota bacterium]